MSKTAETAIRKLLELVIRPSGNRPINHAILYLNDPEKGSPLALASGKLPAHDSPASISFRTGSISKPFTATLILQLVEEGKLRLQDRLLDLVSVATGVFLEELLIVNGQHYSKSITVEHLLRHRSGLRDYFSDDPRFVEQLLRSPEEQWNWKRVMAKYFALGLNVTDTAPPGNEFHYADTNYLLLGRLIEEISGQTYHDILRKRILVPLNLEHTYLEFYERSEIERPLFIPHYGPHSLARVNTSFDWGGGGLVSTARELDVFFRALFSGSLFQNKDTLAAMLAFRQDLESDSKNGMAYGLGLQQKQFDGRVFTGHSSAYGALYYYSLDTGLSIFLTVDQAMAFHKAEWLFHRILKAYLG